MISITEYIPFHKYRGYAHLELGAANYGPLYLQENKQAADLPCYLPSSAQHLLLKKIALHVILNNRDRNCFVFFLNDVDQIGLNRAAIQLRGFLWNEKRKGQIDRVTIKIVKIAADMITYRSWPKVDSAHLLNPDKSIRCIDLFKSLRWPLKTISPRVSMLCVLKRVSKACKSGVYVSDINVSKKQAKFINEIMKKKPETFKQCLNSHGILCLSERISPLTDYIFPSGAWKADKKNYITFRAIECNRV